MNCRRLKREHLVGQITSAEEERVAHANLRLNLRREALSIAAARTLRTAAEVEIASRIEPLTDEVSWRWKRLFGSEGLVLRPDGRITRTLGDRELSFADLSGGERIWASLVARLLLLGASTCVPFAMLDEPLEHLDPKLRRTVATTLINASSKGGLRQIVVTTYEHALARQLAEDLPDANIVVIRDGVRST